MSAIRPLSPVLRTGQRKDQQRKQPRKRPGRRRQKATTTLLFCLAIFLLLVSPASTRYTSQKPPASQVPLTPVGNAVIVTAPGFDTCVAPPAPLLKTWWDRSPYRWLNVYLGGVSMFPDCGG